MTVPGVVQTDEIGTFDLNLAAFLVASGFKCRLEEDQTRRRLSGTGYRHRFLFPPEAQPLVNQYCLDEATVNVTCFTHALKNLRDRCYAQR